MPKTKIVNLLWVCVGLPFAACFGQPLLPTAAADTTPSPQQHYVIYPQANSVIPTPSDSVNSPRGRNSNFYYTVQYQTTRNVYMPKNQPFSDVVIEETENGFFRYFMGKVYSLEEAQTLVAQAVAAGFPNAFIVKKGENTATDGIQGMPIETGQQSGGVLLPQPSGGVTPSPSEFDVRSVPTSTTTTKTYKIQFQSTKNIYTGTKDNVVFDDVEIYEVNGWYKYFTGNATTLTEAKALLDLVIAKGFKGAFIVAFQGGKPLK